MLSVACNRPVLRPLGRGGEDEHEEAYARLDEQRAVMGALLGALLAADSPALLKLDAYDCELEDCGAAAVLGGLLGNTHLRTLDLRLNDLTEDCAQDTLLPAVHAAVQLTTLFVDGSARGDAFLEAERIVAARNAL